MAISSITTTIDALFSMLGNTQPQRQALAQNMLAKGADAATKGNRTAAVQAFKASISMDPSTENAVKAYQLIAAIQLQDSNVDEAIKAYQASLRLKPDNDAVHLDLGNAYFSKGQYANAEKEYQSAVNVGSVSATELYSLGQAQLFSGNYEDAESQFLRVISMNRSNHGGYYALGQTYYKEGRYQDAVQAFEKVIELKPDFYDVYIDLGSAYADLQQPDKAQEQLDILQKNAPELANQLSSYIDLVTAPRITAEFNTSLFDTALGPGTKLAYLSGILATADAVKSFNVTFKFNKDMDPLSVQNPFNWTISRSRPSSPAGPYNWGMPVPETEVRVDPVPVSVVYRQNIQMATVTFTLRQNETASGTVDPSHIVFQFKGTDRYGNKIDATADEYSGVSKIV